jgi:hypothetical protein
MEPLVKAVMNAKLSQALSALPDAPVVPEADRPPRRLRPWVGHVVQGTRVTAAVALRRAADRVDPCRVDPCPGSAA